VEEIRPQNPFPEGFKMAKDLEAPAELFAGHRSELTHRMIQFLVDECIFPVRKAEVTGVDDSRRWPTLIVVDVRNSVVNIGQRFVVE
jgi:hypothetical protein